MANTIPEQYRAVDPFASYNSNTVNQITEVRSRGENVLDNRCGLDVVADATSASTAVVQPGYCFKDDIMIRVTEEHDVDLTDQDNYVSFDLVEYTTGYYYIVLEYTYVKSRPAPEATIKVIMPGQRGNYDYGSSSTSLIFLKAVYVSSTAPFTIDTFHDYDPTLTDNERTYAKRYVTPFTQLPSHEQCEHEGMLAYETDSETYWIGTSTAWIRLAGKYVYEILDGTGAGGWSGPDGNGDYYHDIDVSGLTLDSKNASVTCKDWNTDRIISPGDVEFISTDTIRIYMPVFSRRVEVTII